MANEFTSIATQPGIATELVQDVWDTAVRYALRELPTCRQFVDVRPQSPMSRGSSTTIEKIEWFGKATVEAMKTPLAEESDVDSTKLPKPTPVPITPNEYGAAVTRTRKLTERTFAPVDPIAALLIAQAMNEVVDGLVQDKLRTLTATRPSGAAGTNNIQNTHVLTASMVRTAVTRLRTNKVPAWFGNFYAGIVHPHVILDLRTETGAGGWRVPNEYGASQDRIWAGEIGEFEGVRFVENALVHTAKNTHATPASVYQNYILGRGALAEQTYVEPHVVISPVTDKLKRFHTVGWHGDLGFAVYEAKAAQRLETGSSLGNDL